MRATPSPTVIGLFFSSVLGSREGLVRLVFGFSIRHFLGVTVFLYFPLFYPANNRIYLCSKVIFGERKSHS